MFKDVNKINLVVIAAVIFLFLYVFMNDENMKTYSSAAPAEPPIDEEIKDAAEDVVAAADEAAVEGGEEAAKDVEEAAVDAAAETGDAEEMAEAIRRIRRRRRR